MRGAQSFVQRALFGPGKMPEKNKKAPPERKIASKLKNLPL